MLLEHHRRDAAHGLDSTFLSYFEGNAERTPRVTGLGLTWRSSVRCARARFGDARSGPADCLVYHNVWGLPLFADADQANRRLGVLHTDHPGLAACLRRLRGLLDGLLCVSRPLLDLARRELPELEAERLAWLPYPLGGNELAARQPPLKGRPPVLGFAGRLAFAQKRVDRFPEVVRRLREAGVEFRIEFLGDGPQESWLRQRFAGVPEVTFHGRRTGEAYREVLRGWDVVVYVSDYEGLPITLLEALAAGVIPVYPRIGSGGDEYAARVWPELLYESGDQAAAGVVAAIRNLLAQSEEEIVAIRRRCLEAVRPHLGDCYLGTFASFTRRILELPRQSRSVLPPRAGYVSDWVPMGVLRRVWPSRLWQPNRPDPV